jgi:trehalose-6-phosphate synthase
MLAGAANDRGESILVNPVDDEEVSQAILRALQLSSEEQCEKIKSFRHKSDAIKLLNVLIGDVVLIDE